MIGARGIVVAGVVAAIVTASHAAYRWWPVTRGAEICVPAALYRQPVSVGVVMVRLPIAQIELDVPHTAPAVTEEFVAVRKIGGWWIAGGDARANARALRGRRLYLQLVSGQPVGPGSPAEARAVSVSDAPIDGALNLAGTVSRLREDGYVWLDFSIGWIGVPRAVEASARSLEAAGPVRVATGGPMPRAAEPGVYAVLRVLPSGRAALTGVVVKGERY